MFKQDIVATQKAATLTATHPAIPASVTLRLRSENGTTDRANSLLGNLTIAHSSTKELGGGFRHVVRLNLREQGDIPGASVYFVIVNQDSLLGESRAIQCFLSLIGLLPTLTGDLVTDPTSVDDLGCVLSYKDSNDDSVNAGDAIQLAATTFLPRLLGRES